MYSPNAACGSLPFRACAGFEDLPARFEEMSEDLRNLRDLRRTVERHAEEQDERVEREALCQDEEDS